MPFSKCAGKSFVFKICRRKMCRFRVNGRPIRHIFHRFQNVPASCERCLNVVCMTHRFKYTVSVGLAKNHPCCDTLFALEESS